MAEGKEAFGELDKSHRILLFSGNFFNQGKYRRRMDKFPLQRGKRGGLFSLSFLELGLDKGVFASFLS
jgi:hypothetical protein